MCVEQRQTNEATGDDLEQTQEPCMGLKSGIMPLSHHQHSYNDGHVGKQNTQINYKMSVLNLFYCDRANFIKLGLKEREQENMHFPMGKPAVTIMRNL